MSKPVSSDDPRGLIRDAYQMEGITPAQCRTIFLDWALEPRGPGALRAAAKRLLQHYSPPRPSHPMTEILQAALVELPAPDKRRGGSRARAIPDT